MTVKWRKRDNRTRGATDTKDSLQTAMQPDTAKREEKEREAVYGTAHL